MPVTKRKEFRDLYTSVGLTLNVKRIRKQLRAELLLAMIKGLCESGAVLKTWIWETRKAQPQVPASLNP